MVRKKNRYLVIKIQHADEKIDVNINEFVLVNVIRSSIKSLYGDYGQATYGHRLHLIPDYILTCL